MDIFSLFVSNHLHKEILSGLQKVIWCRCKRVILIYIIFVSFLRYTPFLFVVLLHAKTSDLIKLCCVNNIGFYPLRIGELWGLERWLSWGIASCSSTGRVHNYCRFRSRNSASSLAPMGSCTYAHTYTHKHVHMHQF